MFIVPISARIRFGDSEEGRLRLYQTSDIVLLLLNNEMTDSSGSCYSSSDEAGRKEDRFAVFVSPYGKTVILVLKELTRPLI